MNCDLCGGTGYIPVMVKNPYTGQKYTDSSMCLCKKSKIISDTYELLGHKGFDYLPFDKMIAPFNQIDPEKWDLSKISNYIITGDSSLFCDNLKSLIMQVKFSENPMSVFFEPAINLVQKYHVKQADGSSPNVTELVDRGLMVLVFNTSENNKALQGCVAQIIASRLWVKRPTWIYLTRALANCLEYNEELLSEHFKQFKRIGLAGVSPEQSIENKSKIQADLSEFGRS